MPFELQQVRRRIGTARQIRKVTQAMQRVAAARLVNDRRALDNGRRYMERLTAVLREAVIEAGEARHPLLAARAGGGPVTVILLGSDRGLCGGYHSQLMEELERFLSTQGTRPLQAIVVGKVLQRRVRRRGLEQAQALPQPARAARGPVVDALAATARSGFLSGAADEVWLLYTQFVSGLRQRPVARRILPLPFPVSGDRALPGASFEPGGRLVLERLLPEFVRQAIDAAFLDSLASEDAARQTAMARASENAEDMLKELLMGYRRLRQESITTEMLEIVTGTFGRE